MVRIVIRWSLPLAALFVVGPLAGWWIGSLRAADGGGDVSLLVSATPLAGVAAGVIGLLLAAGGGVLTARLFGVRPGLTVAGLTVAWAAWRTGSVTELLRTAGDGTTGVLVLLTLEGALLGAAVLVMIALVLGAGRGRSEHGPVETEEQAADREWLREAVRGTFVRPAGLAGVGAGVAGALVVAWFLGHSSMRGQALMTAVLAGIGAGAASHLASAWVDPEARPALSGYAGVVIAGVLGPLTLLVAHGGGLASAAWVDALIGTGRQQPLDWAAGACLGVPIGLGWAGAMSAPKREEPRRYRVTSGSAAS